MDKFPPNSHKSREGITTATTEKKKTEKVVSGKVTTKKKSGFGKLVDMFISEDVGNIKTYIVQDVVVPTIKDTLLEVAKRLLWGGDSDRGSRGTSSKISYTRYYDRNNDRRASTEPRSSNRFDCDEIIINSRGEAEEVLVRMEEVIGTYGVVSVLDFYDMVDLTAPHTANKYGWTELGSAKVVPVRGGGYIIKLPRALPID